MSDNDQNSRFRVDENEEEQAGAEEQQANGNGRGPDSEYNDEDDSYSSPEQFEKDKSRLLDFLQYPRDRRKLTDFLEDTYRQYEHESVKRAINRAQHEHESELQGATPYHKPGHIGSLMYEYLNMIGVEAAFVSGLQHTKSSMTKTVQQRVDEINTLLRGVGGFNRQIKASFSRSAVVYLEQEDPRNKHRERVVFTVNLGDFELRYPMDETADQTTVPDGRTVRRMVWDEAVNTLAEIVSNTGLKPKYVKNDKKSCIFTMRQYLLRANADNTPDEYFTFDLRHVNEESRERMAEEYGRTLHGFEQQIRACEEKMKGWFISRHRREELKEQIKSIQSDLDFYVGTHADPREMDHGLVFSIEVNTLKDYGITKDKMQVIMTKYILALSKIAVDKSSDQQVNTVYQRKQAKANDFQTLNLQGGEEPEGSDKRVVMMKTDVVRSKKAAGGGGGSNTGGSRFKI